MIEKRSKEIIADIQLSNDTMRRHIDKRDDEDAINKMFDIYQIFIVPYRKLCDPSKKIIYLLKFWV